MILPADPRQGRTLLLINPASGGGRAARVAPQVEGYLAARGVPFEAVRTTSAADLEHRASQATAQGFTHVAALGGDGAFHFALNGAFGTPVALAFLPCGNGNDIALGLGIPTDAVAAAAALVRAPLRRIDVLRVHRSDGDTRVFIGVGGMGLDGEAALLVHGRLKPLPGVVRYVVAALWALASYQPLQLTLTLDGAPRTGPVLFAAAANAPSYGAGLKIAPEAQMDDGWMDVTIVDDMSWTRLVDAILPILRTGDLRWPEIHRFRARRARFEADRPAVFHADGELLGEGPVDVEVLPRAVTIAGAGRS